MSTVGRSVAKAGAGVGRVAVARAAGAARVSRQGRRETAALRGDALAFSCRERGNQVLVAAAASETAEAGTEARSTLRIKLKCYSAEPLTVRALFLLLLSLSAC